MSVWLILGWLGNGCYFLRFLVQWLVSERAGRSVAPRSFWWFSLGGSSCLTVYSLARSELVLLLGYLVTTLVYVRILWISLHGADASRVHPLPALALALVTWLALVWFGARSLSPTTGDAPTWIAIGIAGESIWCSRFLVQWWHSERRGPGEFPLAFWWISLAGNALLLSYAVRTGDAVYIAGLALGPLVQLRNLAITLRARKLTGSCGPRPARDESEPG